MRERCDSRRAIYTRFNIPIEIKPKNSIVYIFPSTQMRSVKVEIFETLLVVLFTHLISKILLCNTDRKILKYLSRHLKSTALQRALILFSPRVHTAAGLSIRVACTGWVGGGGKEGGIIVYDGNPKRCFGVYCRHDPLTVLLSVESFSVEELHLFPRPGAFSFSSFPLFAFSVCESPGTYHLFFLKCTV